MTQKEAMATVRALGNVVLAKVEGEYQVRVRGAKTDAATYFTDDREDAVLTAGWISRTLTEIGITNR